MRRFLSVPVAVSAAAVGLSVLAQGACSSSKSSCTPGQSIACTGPGGCTGGQVCSSDGTGYGSCVCGTTPDAGISPDGGNGPDAGSGPDAGVDAGVTSCSQVTPMSSPLQLPATNCPAFTFCGGNPVGVWTYAGGCLVDPIPDLSQDCSGATVTNLQGTISGCVSFSATTVTRTISSSVTATLTLPGCAAACATFQAALVNSLPQTTCSITGADCVCAVAATQMTSDSNPYTVSGTTLLVNGNTYVFCVAGNSLQYIEAAGANPIDKTTYTLTRQ